MHKITCIYSVILFIILSACANQTAPTGGPRDETPPILLESKPKQGQLHYDRKEISLTFDELVRTENPQEQFIITPRIADEYVVKFRKNTVIIVFKESLEDSTTYSINFREGIKDITEGNAADTLRLAFSTGHYLDSLSVKGTIKHLLTNKKLDDITVSLYEAHDTLNVLNSPPLYLTKTNKAGEYNFQNLKTGEYKIYALADKNKNMMLDSKTESHGFKSEIIALDTNITSLDLAVQQLDVRELTLQSARQSGTTFNIKVNKYLTDYDLFSMDGSLKFYSNFADDSHNEVQIFKPENLQDSSAVNFLATDSINSELRDTVMVKFEPTQRSPADFTVQTQIDKIPTNKPIFEAFIEFTKPVAQINDDSIYVYLDSANIIPFEKKDLTWNNHRDKLRLTAAIDPQLFKKEEAAPDITDRPPIKAPAAQPKIGQENDTTAEDTTKEKLPPPKPHFYAAPASFISAERDSSQSIRQDLIFMRPDQLAIIIINVETDKENFVVQLLNSRNEVTLEEANSKRFKFRNVEPGEYRIRVLVDSNNNGQWDPGNIYSNTEPEPVHFYSGADGNQVIKPRANWELGPSIISF